MSLQEFARDIVPIIQLIVSILALSSLVLLWHQLKQTNVWNKIQSHQNFVDPSTSVAIERQLYDALRDCGLEAHLNRSITADELKKVMENADCYFALKAFLNDLEMVGAAISIGAADPDFAYAVHSSRFMRAYNLFLPFMQKMRELQSNPAIYIEIEKNALECKRKLAAVDAGRTREIESLNNKLAALRKV